MEPMTWLYLLAGALIVVGLLGTVLPVLPGLPLMFAGMLLAGWVGDFQVIGGWTLALLGVLTIIASAIDLVASAAGAKRVGASNKAVIGAALGTLGGLFFALPGLIIGPFIGAVAGELLHRRSADRAQFNEAARVGFATWVGLAVGAALKLAVAFTMIGIFALSIWID